MHNPLDVTAPGELETIAAARRTLRTWERRADDVDNASENTRDSYRLGMVVALCRQADGRVFDVLNVLASYVNVDVPDDVLYVSASDEPQPPKREVRVVVHVESDPPEVLGTFIAEDRGFVVYLTTNGVERSEPAGSVSVVTIAV